MLRHSALWLAALSLLAARISGAEPTAAPGDPPSHPPGAASRSIDEAVAQFVQAARDVDRARLFDVLDPSLRAFVECDIPIEASLRRLRWLQATATTKPVIGFGSFSCTLADFLRTEAIEIAERAPVSEGVVRLTIRRRVAACNDGEAGTVVEEALAIDIEGRTHLFLLLGLPAELQREQVKAASRGQNGRTRAIRPPPSLAEVYEAYRQAVALHRDELVEVAAAALAVDVSSQRLELRLQHGSNLDPLTAIEQESDALEKVAERYQELQEPVLMALWDL